MGFIFIVLWDTADLSLFCTIQKKDIPSQLQPGQPGGTRRKTPRSLRSAFIYAPADILLHDNALSTGIVMSGTGVGRIGGLIHFHPCLFPELPCHECEYHIT